MFATTTLLESLASYISLLNAETSLATKAKALVQAALDNGGNDNITIVIAEILS